MKYIKYQPVGTSNPINIMLALMVGAALAVFLGWIYNLTFLIPVIYFNFLLTIGFGLVIAILVQILAKLFKIRERKTRLYLVIALGVIGYYSHWVAYVLYIVSESVPGASEFLQYWIYPQNILGTIGEINKYGTWSFGFLRDAPVNGLTLTVIWLMEVAIIFTIGIRYTMNFPENPFSERLNKWYEKYTLDHSFGSFYSEEAFLKSIKEEGIDLILNWDKGLAYKYAEVSIFYLAQSDIQYVSIDNIFIERNNKSKKNITPVVLPISISNEEAQKLMDVYGSNKRFFLDF